MCREQCSRRFFVNCGEGMLAAPVEPGLKCGHPMAGECAEVVAKCRVKATTSSSSRRGICGGGSKSLPAESILRPEPGATGWFN
jgi:hypothetical protein